MSYSSAWAFDTEALILTDQRVRASPKLMERALKRQQTRLRTRALRIVRVVPGKPHYPLRWASQKQRRKVMAMLREQNNLPYQRTGALEAAWEAMFSFTEDGGAFILENTSPAAVFVIGERQQLFHADTGWIYAPSVVDEIAAFVVTAYVETWRTINDPDAGVR